MKQLNETATRIFCTLLQALGQRNSIQLKAGEFMPLSIERIITDVETTEGLATLYSLAHYYDQQGDLMRDPEMCFLVIDIRMEEKDYNAITIYPQMFRQDNAAIEEESITIEGNKVVSFIPVWQKDHCAFANQWLKNIKSQGFLLKR